MANEILVKNDTPIVLADVTDFNPTAGVTLSGTRTDQLDLTGLAMSAYRQSAKVDFGAARAKLWILGAAIEPGYIPQNRFDIDFYIGWSGSGTAANDNPANLTGVDGAWTGYGTTASDADDVLSALSHIGTLRLTRKVDVFVSSIIGTFIPMTRWGIVVVKNNLDVPLAADAVEMSVHLWPLIDENQDAPA